MSLSLCLLMEKFSPGASTLLAFPMSSTCTSQVPSSLFNISVLKEGNVLGLWEGLKEWQRWGFCSSVEAGSEWEGEMGVQGTNQQRAMEEWSVAELCKGCFVERILSVLCIFLPCLSAWIEVSPLNYQLLHDSSMFLQTVQSGICLSMWWQECSLFWSL